MKNFILVCSITLSVSTGLLLYSTSKGKMLSPDVVADITGHPVGGVCPFGLARPLPIYLDVSLKAFDDVLPAAGSVNSAVRISVALLEQVTQGQWVDVCQGVAG